MIISAFTCTGPYAILILLGIKRVENRSQMPVPAKGRCAVSCSKSFCREEFGDFVQWASRFLTPEDFALLPAWRDVADWPGRIVGTCDYAARGRNDLTLSGETPARAGTLLDWDEGYDTWWDLSGIVRLANPIPCRGNVGMWQMPADLAVRVTEADRLSRSMGSTGPATASDAKSTILTF